jgi:hypothetical protein
MHDIFRRLTARRPVFMGDSRRIDRTYEKTAFTESLQEYFNQEMRVRTRCLPLAAIR